MKIFLWGRPISIPHSNIQFLAGTSWDPRNRAKLPLENAFQNTKSIRKLLVSMVKGIKIDMTALGPSRDDIMASLPAGPAANREYVSLA